MTRPRLPLPDTALMRPASRSGRTARTTGRISRLGFLNTGNRYGNIILRLSVAVFCFGIILQATSGFSDPYRCGALVKHGSWPPYSSPRVDVALDYEQLEALEKDGRGPPPARPFEKWEPAGCRMHEYSREDIGYCLGGKRMLFVGDSAARVIFFAALTRLDHDAAEWLLRSTFVEDNPRHDLTISSESVLLDFIWDPWLNSSVLAAELSPSDPQRADLFQAAGKPEPPPKADLVVIGSSGLWAARNAGDDYFEVFQTATDLVAGSIRDTIQPFAGERETSSDNYVFLTPVTVPRYEALPPDRSDALSPERISRMNNYLASLPSTVQSHILTAYNEMTEHIPETYKDTGLHVSDAVAERWIDIPLNARCNGLLARQAKDKPANLAFKATCCVAYPGLVPGQWYLLAATVVAVLIPVIFFFFGRRGRALASSCSAVPVLSLAVLLCYVADRTHLFPKAEKRYGVGWGFFSFVAAGIACLSSWRHAWAPDISQQHGFLPRHVSDEWKGLMQMAFLLMAYQNSNDGTSRLVPSNWAELATNSYLFLSAFGHTSYFLKNGDCSFRRVASVLFRLNILPCLLAFMLDGLALGTPASVAHLSRFSQLVAFWFLVTCVTMGLGSQRHRSRPGYSLARVCASALIFYYAVLIPRQYDLFAYASRAGLSVFDAKWEVDTMRSAVASAWCAPFFGMALAVFSRRVALIRSRTMLANSLPQQGQRSKKLAAVGQSFINNDSSWIDRLLVSIMFPSPATEPLHPMIVIFSGIFIFLYAEWVTLSPPAILETSHPLSTSVVVICLAIVRNCHEKVQSTYLFLPSVLGGFALELSLLSNHLLLAGNGTGRLRLFSTYASPTEGNAILGGFSNAKVALYQSAETISIVTVFIALCWRSHDATRQVAAMLFGKSAKPNSASESYGAHDPDDTHATDEEGEYGLPVIDADLHPRSKSTRARIRAWLSDARLRALFLMLVFWGLNRRYL